MDHERGTSSSHMSEAGSTVFQRKFDSIVLSDEIREVIYAQRETQMISNQFRCTDRNAGINFRC